MRDCRDRLIREGVDLAGYTTSAIAADIADLRRALNIGPWNLYGVSYGTQIALTVMRDHPEGLRAVILDSPMPLQTAWYSTYWSLAWSAMERMFDACAANPRCQKFFPDLRADYSKLIDQLNGQPVVVRRPHPLTGETLSIPITGSLLGEMMSVVLAFHRWDQAVYVLAKLRQGDQQTVEFIGDFAMWYIIQPVSEGQYFSVVCQDENPLADPEGVSADLKNSFLIEFPDQGHGLAFLSACAPQVMSAFLADSGKRPDEVCLNWLTEPTFLFAP
jgi:pimeloyl-ACP methyl ester carboxylesterase